MCRARARAALPSAGSPSSSAHWWDREAAERQRGHALGLRCGRCGAPIDLPAPLVQYRRLDAADLVIGLPAASALESDKAWIAAIVDVLRADLDKGPAVVTVRMSWWQDVDRVPLGPALAGLAGPPQFPEPPGERDRWLAATRGRAPATGHPRSAGQVRHCRIGTGGPAGRGC